ncbi:MAG: N-acetylmuramoyl-L-alanine amidase [Ruminococcus sp.]|nr:N-acetylmuramoyl-L-alanine amidase [Ruminococcus sp.]
MADSNSKPVVRRLHKGRLYGCLTILVLFIIIISSIISGCSKRNNEKDKKDKDSSVVDVINPQQTQQDEYVKDKYVIYIDPGHGGNDPGSNNGDRYEKVDNLRYATVVYEELLKKDNIEPVIIRTDNQTFFSNEEKAKMANDADADLYLALHRNHSEDWTACGVEIWVQKEKDVVDEVLGYKLLQALSAVGIQSNRGVQAGYTNDSQGNFQIIEYTNMPCCIVELGFISNDEDNRLFDKNYKEYGIAIANVAEQMCLDGYLDEVVQ